MRHNVRHLAVAVMVCSLLLGSCGGSGKNGDAFRKPNILLITLDTVRADRLGCYGYAKSETPAIDALAEGGVLFEQAFSSAPITLPSHTSIMTGLHPPEHGVRENDDLTLSQDATTLAEVFERDGYRTGAFLGAFVLDSVFGLNQGFDIYDDVEEIEINGSDLSAAASNANQRRQPERRASEVVDSALSWLQEDGSAPFFCWVHLYDPHAPYSPPEPYATRFEHDRYDGEIAFVDNQIDRLLSWLDRRGLTDNTLVVLVSDHGEGLGEHDELRHAIFVYDATMRVPMIFSLPGRIAPSKRIPTPVGLVDVFPTITAIADIEVPVAPSGRSLATALTGGSLEPHDIYGESNYPFDYLGCSPLRSLITPRWKYIRSPVSELFDKELDPLETTNLAEQRGDIVRKMEQRLLAMEQSMIRLEAERIDLTAAQRQRLAALGYMGSGTSGQEPVDYSTLKDPKEMVTVFNQSTEVLELIAAGESRKALALLKKLVQQNPHNAQFLSALARALVQSGDLPSAADHFRRAIKAHERRGLDKNISTAGLYSDLAQVLARIGKLDEAISFFEKALEIHSRNAMVLNNLATAQARKKCYLESVLNLRKAHDIDPENRSVLQNLERALQLLVRSPDRYEDGLRLLSRQKVFDSTDLPVMDVLARVLAASPDDSLRNCARALELSRQTCRATHNRNPIYLDTLAIVHSNTGRFEEAIAFSQLALEIARQFNDKALAGSIKKRLELYESRRPYRMA